MSHLRATTHLADGANQMFSDWIEDLGEAGFDIDGAAGDDTSLDADVVFACGLLTTVRQKQGQSLNIVGAPRFPGETNAVYRSVIVVAPHVAGGLDEGSALRLAVNEYDSWSGWHGLKEHLRSSEVPASAIASHVLTGGHVDSIEAIISGGADVASIDHSMWNARSEVDERLGELRILDHTRDWPAPPISIRSTLPVDEQRQLADAIVSLTNVYPADQSDYAFMLTEVEEYPTWP